MTFLEVCAIIVLTLFVLIAYVRFINWILHRDRAPLRGIIEAVVMRVVVGPRWREK